MMMMVVVMVVVVMMMMMVRDVGGREVSQWKELTGSVPLKLIGDCVSFTSNLSARYHHPTSLCLRVYYACMYVCTFSLRRCELLHR